MVQYGAIWCCMELQSAVVITGLHVGIGEIRGEHKRVQKGYRVRWAYRG